MRKFIWISIYLLVLIGCSKDSPSTLDLKEASEYYPLKLGAWYIYDVDSISYNDFNESIDSLTYQVKEELTDTFYDLEGSLSYEITRSKRFGNDSVDVESVPWKVSDIWWVKNRGGSIERTEENNRYITLSNPISEGKTWKGNAYNTMSALNWDFAYKNIADTFGQYSNTVTVIQEDFDTNVDSVYFREVFAKEIGLVSRSRTDLYSNNSLPFIHMIDKAEKGFQYHQTLNSYYIPE